MVKNKKKWIIITVISLVLIAAEVLFSIFYLIPLMKGNKVIEKVKAGDSVGAEEIMDTLSKSDRAKVKDKVRDVVVSETNNYITNNGDYDKLKKILEARSKTQSKYVRDEIGSNVITHSNGESALQYFAEKIKDNGLYLLDEPENSLSPQRQLELLELIQNSARFFGCQFIIATHSPFLLALKGARIYDLDESPVDIKKWTELEGVRTYFEFFEQHRDEFV